MGAGVATVGRRAYAVGLYWENSPSGRVSQTAKEAARQPGQEAEFYAVRAGSKEGRVPQFGLSPKGAGHKAGLPSFAACLANEQHGSWIGAFRVKEGVVVTIVRDDLVAPDGDQFYADEMEARERFMQEVGFGGFQRSYAPEAWAVPGADTMPISLLLNERADVRLSPIEIPKKFLILGSALALLLLIALGVGWYIQEEQARMEAERIAQEQALQRAREQAQKLLPGALQGQQIVYPPPERMWEKRPVPLAVIAACREALAQVPVAVAGWRMDRVKCGVSGLNVMWSRATGFSVPPASFKINEKGDAATLDIALPPLPPRPPEDLPEPTEVTRRYLAQNWPGTIFRGADDPPPPPPPDFKGEWNPPPAPWVKRSFTVTVPVLPWTLTTLFGDLPGVVVDSLGYEGGSWKIDGVIYENRR